MGDQYQSGQMIDGTRHEDLMNLSFDNNSFDLVITSDVIEHIPIPYRAQEEIWRVLKPGGIHVFTVPFHQTEYLDDVRARLDGNKVEFLKEPIYHTNLLKDDVILVFTIFICLAYGNAMAERLAVKRPIANVRSGPGAKFEILWKIEKYHPILVQKRDGEWIYFQDFEKF